MEQALIDFATRARLEEAAPRVTRLSADVARSAVRALITWSGAEKESVDLDGRVYHKALLKDLHKLAGFGEETSVHKLGATYRSMGLISWRQNDGFHVAWSNEQLQILTRYLGLVTKTE